MRDNHIKQADLARSAGMTRQQIHRILDTNRPTDIDLLTLALLCDRLGYAVKAVPLYGTPDTFYRKIFNLDGFKEVTEASNDYKDRKVSVNDIMPDKKEYKRLERYNHQNEYLDERYKVHRKGAALKVRSHNISIVKTEEWKEKREAAASSSGSAVGSVSKK